MESLTFPSAGAVHIQIAVAVADVRVLAREHASGVGLHITGEKEPDQVTLGPARAISRNLSFRPGFRLRLVPHQAVSTQLDTARLGSPGRVFSA